MSPPRWRVDLSLVFVALVWGATFVMVKRALPDVSTLLFLTLRFTIAAAALGLILHRALAVDIRNPALLGRSVRAGVLAGTCLFAGYVFQTFGLKYTTAAKAGFITGLYIPLVPVFSAIVYQKAPHVVEWLGVGCAFLGMALMTIQRDIRSIGIGDMLVMVCAVAYAFHILVLGRYAADLSVAILSIVQVATAGVFSAATFWWAETPHIRWSQPVIIALAVTSLVATALAFSIQTWAQQYSPATRTALLFSLEPVFTWVSAYIASNEVLSGRALSGAGLIMAGILLVEWKPLRSPIMGILSGGGTR